MSKQACCLVGAHADADAIDAALRAGGPDGSVRAIAKRFGVGKTAVSDHRAHIGLRTAADTATQAAQPPDATRQAGQHATDASVAAAPGSDGSGQDATGSDGGADTQVEAQDGVSTTACELPRARAFAADGDDAGSVTQGEPAGPPPPPPPPAAAVSALSAGDGDVFHERVQIVANIIAMGMWRDWSTVTTLAGQWRCSHDEVHRMHYAAARLLKRARGGLMEQLEASVARAHRLQIANEEQAAEYDKEALDIQKKVKKETDWTKSQLLSRAATSARKAALDYRNAALVAQKHRDDLTLKREAEVRVRVDFSGDPRFQEGFEVVARILDALFPGGSALLDEGVATYEAGGEGALLGWLENTRRNLAALPATGEDVT